MTYSNELFKNQPSLFPPPPRWLTWVQELERTVTVDKYGHRTYSQRKLSEGKLRHHDTIQTAKKSVTWTGRGGSFEYNWAIYEWVDDKYVLRFSGKIGQDKATNPLFLKGVVSSKKNTPVQAVPDHEMDAALASILGTGSMA